MKRIVSMLLVLLMVFSLVPPLPVRAQEGLSENRGLGFSEDTMFGRLLNTAIEEEDTGGNLPDYIRQLTVSGKTATVHVTVPMDALLVVGIYDEEQDNLLGSGVLEVSAREDEQVFTVPIEIDAMPDYFRGKAFLLSRNGYAPISRSCQFEISTRGYQNIADARTTDFPEELVLNLDADTNTNFVVYKEGTVSVDISGITKTGTNTFTITNASPEIKAMGTGDVLRSTMEDGSPFLIKAASVSVEGNTVTVVAAADIRAEDAFQMIKLDIDSRKYGLREAEDPEILPMNDSGENVRLHLLGTTGDDPLHTNTWKVREDKFELEILKGISITVPIEITTQYYWSAPYSYYSAAIHYTFDMELDLGKKELGPEPLKWTPTVDVQTPIPGVSVEGIAEIQLKIEAGHSYHLKIQGSFGQEFFAGSGRFHDISESPRIVNEYAIKGTVELSFAMGVGLSFVDLDDVLDVFEGMAIAELSVKGKTFFKVEATLIGVTDDLGDKIHVCQGCSKLEITMGLSVVGERTLLLIFKWSTEIPLDQKKIATGHFCWLHDDPAVYPYEYGMEQEFHRGWTECSRIAYRVELEAKDPEGNCIPNNRITLARADAGHVKIYQNLGSGFRYLPYEELVTDSSGKVTCYLENGTYYARIGGEDIPFVVNNAPGSFTLTGEETLPEDAGQQLLIQAKTPLLVGDTTAVSAVLRAATTDVDVTGDVTWSVEDSSVVSLTEGDAPYLTALKKGSTRLTASVVYLGKTFTAVYEIQVLEIIDSGVSGNVAWTLYSDYSLNIFGDGNINAMPWRSYNPKIKRITIENGITGITSNSFAECVSLESVKLPDTLTAIYSQAFLNCVSLNYIFIPKNVSTLAPDAFLGCTSLVKIEIDPDNPYLKLSGGIILSGDGKKVLGLADRTMETIRIPESVSQIENNAFIESGIRHLQLPDSLVYVGMNAFKDSKLLETVTRYETECPVTYSLNYFAMDSFRNCVSLKKVEFPACINAMGTSAFENCTGLTTITIPEYIKRMDMFAFKDCVSLRQVNLPEQGGENLFFGHGVFRGCTALEEIRLPEGLAYIQSELFQGCTGLRKVNIPESVTDIYTRAFEVTAISELELPAGLKAIHSEAFEGCVNLTELELPDGLETIGTYAFAGSGLRYMVVPDSVIHKGAGYGDGGVWFGNCKNLDWVILGSGVTVVPFGVVADSTAKQVYIRGLLTEKVSWDSFNNCEELTEIFYAHSEEEWPGVKELNPLRPFFKNISIVYNWTSGAVITSQDPEETASSLSRKDRSWYQLSLLKDSSGTGITRETDGSVTVHYDGLIPGRAYLLLMCARGDAALTPENLLYIDQLTAGADGSIACRFTPRVTGTGDDPVLIESVSWGYRVEGLENWENYDVFHADGKPVENISHGLTRKDAVILTGYRYADSRMDMEVPAEFTRYPVAMDVWKLTFRENTGTYQAEKLDQMENLLRYDGCSIRITGVRGIRMITSLPGDVKKSLINGNIGGFTLEEYGTLVCWQDLLEENGGSLTLEDSYVMSNFAYSRTGKKDAVFGNTEDGRVRYTNVLVNFTMDQCKQELCMRPYMILKAADGSRVVVYGGIVTRSIGYIALQNADTFSQGSDAYNYVHSIITHCYPTV